MRTRALSIVYPNPAASIGCRVRIVDFIVCLSGFVFLAVQPAFSQDYSSGLRDNSSCFSCLMRGSGQTIPLLGLPETLERRRGVLEKALGGIGGSSFQTESATPEQTTRQLLKAPQEPVFAAPPVQSALERATQFENPFAERFTVYRSFEEHFGHHEEEEPSFRLFAPELSNPLQVLGGRRRRGLLKEIFSTPGLGQ